MDEAAETPETLLRAAAAYREGGRVELAIQAYEAALRLRPAMPNSWYNLAQLQRRAGRFDEALASYDQALAHGIEGPEEVHLNRGVIFSDDLGRADLAEEALQEALRIAPDYVPALLNLGNLHEDRGALDEARAAFARALAIAPDASTPLARLIGVTRLTGPDDPLAKAARARIARAGSAAEERVELGYALAGALDRAGEWDLAFAAAVEANIAVPTRYDRGAHERFIDRLIAAFPAAGANASGAATGEAPVFILGMFRSGSTLAEQILAKGDGVVTGGELGIVPELAAGLPGYPEAAASAPEAAIAQLRADYLARLRRARGPARFHTDKRPDNFLHVGFIKRLFPDAKIVHTVRAPADMAVSLFFLHLDPAMAYATDLGDIADWYRQYRRLMAHWEALWPDDIHRLDYDTLVADPRPAIEALFRFTGVPHGPEALNYSGSDQAVRTASAGQVHQPLYARASGRWRRYERHLGPFFEALKD
ncbi:MAG TPA: sulfotransferase [Allosphingosinicella sp.]